MKTVLISILKALVFPLVWCRRTVLEASLAVGGPECSGFSDCMNFSSPAVPRAAAIRVGSDRRTARSQVCRRCCGDCSLYSIR